MIKEQFFPTTIYAKDVQLDNDLFTREVVRWSNEDKGIKRTNMNGWHSHTDMHKIPVFKPLVDELFKMQFEVFNEEFLDNEPILGNMWANINPPGGYNRAHLHPNCVWSGVYYVKTPKNCGGLKMKDPRTGAEMISPKLRERYNHPDKMPERLWREVHYEPVAGRCIMFPAWLIHGVEPNESNDIRISVSFNFLQKTMFV